jgi:hypothetical protein
VKKEYFPTLNDIGREVDSGESELKELLPRARRQRADSAARDSQNPESGLRFASAFAPGSGFVAMRWR